MAKDIRSQRPRRLRTPPKIKPLDSDKPLAAYSVPSPPAGKFAAIPGQQAMGFAADEVDEAQPGE